MLVDQIARENVQQRQNTPPVSQESLMTVLAVVTVVLLFTTLFVLTTPLLVLALILAGFTAVCAALTIWSITR